MAFDDIDLNSASSSRSSNGPKIDWDALNKDVVAQVREQLESDGPETIAGVIAGIVDLGTQPMEDAEVEYKGDASQEAKDIAEKPDTYFKDGFDRLGKPIRLKCWPQKPQRCIAIAVDFPGVIVDKGKHFGESKPLPLRLWLGGEFWMGEEIGTVIARPTPLKWKKNEKGTPTFDVKHQLYKMAVDAKVIKPGEAFNPHGVDKLLGKAFLFKVHVHYKDSKKTGKSYYTESIVYAGGLARGMAVPETKTEPFLYYMNKPPESDPKEQLRMHVVNTMRRSQEWEGSVFASLYSDKPSTYKPKEASSKPVERVSQPAAPVVAKTVIQAPVKASDDLGDACPF